MSNMTDSDILACVDYCADHIAHFGMWPGEFEAESGDVFDIDVYLPLIERRAPSLARFLSRAKEG